MITQAQKTPAQGEDSREELSLAGVLVCGNFRIVTGILIAFTFYRTARVRVKTFLCPACDISRLWPDSNGLIAL